MCRLLLVVAIFSLSILSGLAGVSHSPQAELPFLTSHGVPERDYPGFSYAGHVKLHPRTRRPSQHLARESTNPPVRSTSLPPSTQPSSHTFVRLSRSGSVYIGSRDTLLPPDWSLEKAEQYAAGRPPSNRHGQGGPRPHVPRQQGRALSWHRRLAKVFAPDERILMQNTTEGDWRVVGQLDMEEGPHNYTCTATLIGPRWVLTAAHCVYSTDSQQWLQGLDFAPARYVSENSSIVSPFGMARWKHVTTYRAYMDTGYAQYDLALITLEDDIGHAIGWMRYGEQCGDQQQLLPLSLVGFPGDKLPGSLWMSNCSVVVKNCLYSMLFHQCDTFFGMSGSPLVFIDAEGNLTIYGVHVGQNSNLSNVAVALKPLQVSHIKSWIAADEALMANGTVLPPNTTTTDSALDPSVETSLTGGFAVHTMGSTPSNPSQGALGPIVHEPLHISGSPTVGSSIGTPDGDTMFSNGMPEPVYDVPPTEGGASPGLTGLQPPAAGAGGQGRSTNWPQQVVIGVTAAAGCVLVAGLLWGVALGVRWANRRREDRREGAEAQRVGAAAAVAAAMGEGGGSKRAGVGGGGGARDVEAAAGGASTV